MDFQPLSFSHIQATIRTDLTRRYPLLKEDSLADILDGEVLARAAIAYSHKLTAQGHSLEAWAVAGDSSAASVKIGPPPGGLGGPEDRPGGTEA